MLFFFLTWCIHLAKLKCLPCANRYALHSVHINVDVLCRRTQLKHWNTFEKFMLTRYKWRRYKQKPIILLKGMEKKKECHGNSEEGKINPDQYKKNMLFPSILNRHMMTRSAPLLYFTHSGNFRYKRPWPPDHNAQLGRREVTQNSEEVNNLATYT